MRSIGLAVALASVFVAASSAHGFTTSPNLVSNGEFDAGIAGWEVQGQNASLMWSSDTGTPPGSALLQMTPNDLDHQVVSASQCVAIQPGAYYAAQAQVLLPAANQAPGTMAGVFVAWFASPDCSSGPIFDGGGPFGSPQADDQWHLGGISSGAPAAARGARVGVTLVRFEASALPSRVYFDNVSLVHLIAEPPSAADRFENVQVRGQDVSGHVQIRVEVAPNGNYALDTKVLRAQGNGTFCVGFGFDLHETSGGCALPPWTFSVAGASKDPVAFTREYIPTGLPCVIAFRDLSTLSVVAYGRLNFAGCPD